MPGRDPHDPQRRDHWDDEEEVARRYQENAGYEGDAGRQRGRREAAYFGDRGYGPAPRIGPTGMMSSSSTGSSGTSGRYFEDEQGRAAYGGFAGARPEYGPGPGRSDSRRRDDWRDPARRGDYRTDHRLSPEEREAIGGAYLDYGRAHGGYGAGGGYTPTPEEGIGREGRSWDESSAPGSWFGRAPADSWRDERHAQGPHRGRGPKGYTRSGERIREDVSDRLTDDGHLDASDIEVEVNGTEVTLNGTVESKAAKRRAEDCADDATGVTHVQNNLRVRPRPGTVAAETDPRIAAISEGRDADEAARDVREQRDERLGRLQR